MRKILLCCVSSIVLSCAERTNSKSSTSSYWESLKDSFATNHLDSFIIESSLDSTYRNYHRTNNHIIDSAIKYGDPYLYSWQEESPGFTTFTVYVDDGEHGRRIIYFIFDDKDSLRSATQVALRAGEGGVDYETHSRFVAKDTLFGFNSATTIWDFTKPGTPPPRLRKSIGDSTFFQLTIQKNGSVVEKILRVKKELKFE